MQITSSSVHIEYITVYFNNEKIVNPKIIDYESRWWEEADDEEGWIVFQNNHKNPRYERLKGGVRFEFDTSELSEADIRRSIEKYG